MRQRYKLRFKVWKDWYKKCMNVLVYKILVLFGLRKSPTFETELTFSKAKKQYGNHFGQNYKESEEKDALKL